MSAEDQISVIIDNAQNRAGQAFAEALGHMNELSNAIHDLVPSLEIPETQAPPEFNRPDDPPNPSDYQHIPITRSGRPVLDDLQDVYVPDLDGLTLGSDPGDLEAGLFNHQKPSPLGESAPSTLPAGLSDPLPDVGDAPALPPRTPPDLDPLPEIIMPGPVTIPGFQGVRPTQLVPDTNDYRAIMEASYQTMHPQMRAAIDSAVRDWIDTYAPEDRASLQALEERLQTYLAGGTGLSPEIEQGIYDRGRTKLEAEQARPALEAIRSASRRGHELPAPVFFAAQQRLAQAIADANGRAAIDIATKMAEMEQANLQFAVTAAKDLRVALRNIAIQYAGIIGQVNTQALEFAKAVVDSLLDARKAAVTYFEALLRQYEVDGTIYEVLIKAALSDLVRLEAEVRVAQAIGTLDETKARLFQSQIDGDKALVQLYGEKLNLISTELQKRKLLLDQFIALIEAFKAQVQAKESETEIYKALMSGDESKVRAYIAQWQGFSTKAEALVKKADLEIKKSEAVQEGNRNILEVFKAELAEYMADIDLEKVYLDEDFKVFQAGLLKYAQELQRQELIATSDRDNNRLKVERSKYDLDAKVSVAQAQANLNLGAMGHRIQGLQGIADTAGRLAGSYASAIQSLVNLASEDITSQ